MALRLSPSSSLILMMSLGFASCSPTKSVTTSDQPQVAKPAPPGPGEWATWSHDQKLQYMKAVVVLKEKQLFTEYDARRFSNLECKTCHGSGVDNGTYKMPNPELTKWPGGPEAFKLLKATNPKALYFMMAVVGPETAKMLGVKPFDMASHTGFSCFHCHTRGPWPVIEGATPAATVN